MFLTMIQYTHNLDLPSVAAAFLSTVSHIIGDERTTALPEHTADPTLLGQQHVERQAVLERHQ